jgi:hypothetical protein
MLKYFFTISFIITGYPVFSQQLSTRVEWDVQAPDYSGDTIYYNPQQKLTWKEFQGNPDRKSVAAAITASGFGFVMSMNSRGGRSTLVITVNCFFSKKSSWVKSGQKSDYALLHEQHHFDITYIAACGFVKKLKATTFTLQNYQELLEKLNTETYSEMEKMQNDYDGQTKNGQLEVLQEAWNKHIDKQLAALPPQR